MKQSAGKSALAAHSWLGVFLGVFLFLVCLSGTIAVFHQELERWEQPGISEMSSVSPETVNAAMGAFVAKQPEETEHYHVVMPTSGIPRLVVENDHIAYFADSDGNLITTERSPWTKMLAHLHFYLHLPSSWGMIFVSALGAVICSLIFSGFVAHTRILKDAFRLRAGGTGQQFKTDMHNRFGVWAAPFHVVIGVTGAYFGLAGLIIVLVAQLYYGGDRQAVFNKFFTPEPQLEAEVQAPDFAAAFNDLAERAPDSPVVFATVHDANSPQQFIEVYARSPNKFIYSENYRYDAQGNFIERAGYEDGYWGKQIIYSMYRLHFGDFSGMVGKLLYFVLGLMLTYLCSSGIDMWLKKMANPPLLTRVWSATIWGSTSALALSAAVAVVSDISPAGVFWVGVLVAVITGAAIKTLSRTVWLFITAVTIALLLITYTTIHGANVMALASLQINLPLAAFALWCVWRGVVRKRAGITD